MEILLLKGVCSLKRTSVMDLASSVSFMLLAEERTSRHGEAIAEYIKGYRGYTGLNGKHVKGLKDISQMKSSSHQNILQQAGFSAEIFSESKTNADNILNKNSNRVRRTDGIGSVNHTSIDQMAVDLNGQPLLDSNGKWLNTSQMKFRANAKTNVHKLISKKEFDKYKKAEFLDIPSDQFVESLDLLKQRKQNLKNQISVLEKLDKPEELASKREQLGRCESVESRLRDSKVTRAQAEQFRKQPLKETIKRVNQVSHQAAFKQGRDSAIIAALTSLVHQTVLLSKQEKPDYIAAAKVVLKEASFAFGTAYSVTYVSSLLKGWLTASQHQLVKSVSKSSVVTSSLLELSNLIIKYIRTPEYTLRDLFLDLSDKTVAGFIGSFASGAGSLVLSAFLGPMVAGAVGFFVGTTVYSCVKQIMKEATDSTLQLKELEIRAYQVKTDLIKRQKALKEMCDKYLADKTNRLMECIDTISESMESPDHDRFIKGWENLAAQFQIELQYVKSKEFDKFMNDSTQSFVL